MMHCVQFAFRERSIGDIGESKPDMLSPYSDIESPGPSIQSPLHTRSYGKAKKGKKVAQPPYSRGVVYLPGDINGLARKLHLLAAEFLVGNTIFSNELVHVLDALLRLKQLIRNYRSFSSIIMIV